MRSKISISILALVSFIAIGCDAVRGGGEAGANYIGNNGIPSDEAGIVSLLIAVAMGAATRHYGGKVAEKFKGNKNAH